MRELTNSFVELPQMICDSLISDADFRKLICYDSPNALGKDTPTDDEMKAMIAQPVPFEADAKRIFLQELMPTVTESKTTVQIWTAGMNEEIPFALQTLKIKIRVMNHLALETLQNGTKIISRSLAMVQRVFACLCDRLNDPHLESDTFIAGIGKLQMVEVTRITDNRERCGYEITLETNW